MEGRAGLPTQTSEPDEVRLGGSWPAPFHTLVLPVFNRMPVWLNSCSDRRLSTVCTGQHYRQLYITKVFPNTAYGYCYTSMTNKLGKSSEIGAGAGTLQSQPV